MIIDFRRFLVLSLTRCRTRIVEYLFAQDSRNMTTTYGMRRVYRPKKRNKVKLFDANAVS